MNYIHVETPHVENNNNSDYKQFKPQVISNLAFFLCQVTYLLVFELLVVIVSVIFRQRCLNKKLNWQDIHSDTRMLKIQQCTHKIHGFCAFACLGPHIWNSLPQDLRHCSTLPSFKARLKTFLFSHYFRPN